MNFPLISKDLLVWGQTHLHSITLHPPPSRSHLHLPQKSFVCVCVCEWFSPPLRLTVCTRETQMLYKYTEVWLVWLCVDGWIYINPYLRLYSFSKPFWLNEVTGAVEPGAAEELTESTGTAGGTFKGLNNCHCKPYHFVLSCYYCVMFVVELGM